MSVGGFDGHTADEQCTVDPETDACTQCGVDHGGPPCRGCGARAFHVAGCVWAGLSEIDGAVETSDPMTFLTPRHVKVLRKVFEEALATRSADDPEVAVIQSMRDRLYA